MPCPSCLRAGPDTLCVPCGPHGPFLIGLGQWAMHMQSRLSNLRVRISLTLHPDPKFPEIKKSSNVLTLDDLDL